MKYVRSTGGTYGSVNPASSYNKALFLIDFKSDRGLVLTVIFLCPRFDAGFLSQKGFLVSPFFGIVFEDQSRDLFGFPGFINGYEGQVRGTLYALPHQSGNFQTLLAHLFP